MITERLLDEFETYAKIKAGETIGQIERLYKAARAPQVPEDAPEGPMPGAEMPPMPGMPALTPQMPGMPQEGAPING